MESKNNLKWESEVSNSAKGWVTVVPSTGNGDTKVTVNVTNSSGWADPNTLTGEVTFRCTNCKTAEEKKVNVCRCSCSCCDLTNIQHLVTEIKEEGLAKGTTIGSYSLLSRCDESLLTAKITGGSNPRCKCEGGLIKLLDDIPYTQSFENITYHVSISFDNGNLPEGPNSSCDNCCNPCDNNWTIIQKGLDCTCESTVYNRITYSAYFNGTAQIPQSGLTAGTELFRYTLKEHCPENRLSAKIKYGTSTTRDVNVSNGIATLAQNIGDTVAQRTVTLEILYNGDTCYTTGTTQLGCTCAEFLNDDAIFIEIPTFNANYSQEEIAVKPGDKIGTYSKKGGTTCPDNVTASLRKGSTTYQLVCSNGEIKLGGSSNIPENASRDDITFTATIYYNGIECQTKDIVQLGVACNCTNVEGNKISFSGIKVIPKDGVKATDNFILGTYETTEDTCLNFRLVEQNNKATVDLRNGNVVITSNIPKNDEVAEIPFNFIVQYYVNNKWRNCNANLPTKQKGVECSCNSIRIEGSGQWTILPTSGTRGLVTFAKADTGLYNSEQKLVGVCGSLSADCDVKIIIPHDGYNITTKAIDPTEEEIAKGFTEPHWFEFQVDLMETATTAPITARADLYFIPKNSSIGQKCETEVFGFKIDPNACNCQATNMNYYSPYGISCNGYAQQTTIGYVDTGHTGITLEAVLLEDEQEYDITDSSIVSAVYVQTANTINLLITGGYPVLSMDTAPLLNPGQIIYRVAVMDYKLYIYTNMGTPSYDISYLIESYGTTYKLSAGTTQISDFATTTNSIGTLYVKGKVTSNLTSNERFVGVVRVYYWCNKGEVGEWYRYKDFSFKQSNGCTCDCNYVTNHESYYSYWNLNFTPNDTELLANISYDESSNDCIKYYIEDVDEEGYYTLDDWCKVRVVRQNGYWNVEAVFIGEEHSNRTGTVSIKSAYKKGEDETTGEPIYEDCATNEFEITDNVCDCDAIDTSSFRDKTVTIRAGQSTAEECYYSDIFKMENCIQLYIDDNGTPTGTSSTEKYQYKDSGIAVFEAYIRNERCVNVTLLKDLDQSKTYKFTVKARYIKDDGTFSEPCDVESIITVKQQTCTCDVIRNKIYPYKHFYYNQNDTSTEATLDVASITEGCGTATLMVKYGTEYYCSTNINYLPEELDYILGITDVCSKGTLQLVVKPLDENETYRETNLAICICNNDSEDACKCESRDCIFEYTIEETWELDCSSVPCESYDFRLSKEAGNGEFKVRCNESVRGALVATFPTPPECFTVKAESSHEKVTAYQQAIDDNTVGIYIDTEPTDKQESPTIDVAVYKDDQVCSDLSQDFIKITLCGNS